MERTVHFTVLKDGSIYPFTPQYAGVEGEHNAATVILDVSAWKDEDFLYRVEYVDGYGAGDTTGTLYPVNGKISLTLPRGWTNAGGQAVVRLVASVLTDGEEVQTVFAVDAPLYFRDKQDSDQDIEDIATPMLTWLIAEAGQAVENAEKVAADLKTAADNGEFDGEKGEKGENGYTPQKGIDYYTPVEKAEVVNEVLNGVLTDYEAYLDSLLAEQEEIIDHLNELRGA